MREFENLAVFPGRARGKITLDNSGGAAVSEVRPFSVGSGVELKRRPERERRAGSQKRP